MTPEPQPCGTCRHFHCRGKNTGESWGYCGLIEDVVKRWWKGCKRHTTMEESKATKP